MLLDELLESGAHSWSCKGGSVLARVDLSRSDRTMSLKVVSKFNEGGPSGLFDGLLRSLRVSVDV